MPTSHAMEKEARAWSADSKRVILKVMPGVYEALCTYGRVITFKNFLAWYNLTHPKDAERRFYTFIHLLENC